MGGVTVTVMLSKDEAAQCTKDAGENGHVSKGEHLREVWLHHRDA